MKLKSALLMCTFLFFLGVSGIFAQSLEVKGKVVSATTNEPMEGVSVTIKGTSTATVTDQDGNYTITVPQKGTVLVFTNVDMVSIERTANNASLGTVMLTGSANTLQEVMVNVGYGSQKKSVLTGAISKVTARDLEKVPNGRIEQALQGRVSGVTIMQNAGQPGSNSTVRVRGITTFGNNEPLYVVDGIVLDPGAIGYINQADIESIELLKDATSAAIYGTRAATGVILITTKKGKSGKFSVSYHGFYGISAPEKKLDLLNAAEYGALMNEKSVAGGGDVVFPNLGELGVGTDWQKAIFNNSARRYNHEISLSGGSEKSTFYMSFSLQDQEGIVLSDISKYNKRSLRLNSTHKINKYITLGQTLGYTHQRTSGIGNTNSEYGGPLSSAINLDPTTPLVITDPDLANQSPYASSPVVRDQNGNPYGISTQVGQEMTNPLAYVYTRLGHHNWSDDIVGNAYLEVTPHSKVRIRTTIGGKYANWGNLQFNPVNYLSATVSTLKNNYGKSTNNTLNWNLENTIMYSDKIKGHDFSVLLGQGAYVQNNGGSSAVTLFGLPITSFEDASFNFDVPLADRTSGSADFVPHKLASLFGRANYNYNDKYLFTGIARRDGSTRFGRNNKYGTFLSGSAGWVVTKEDFWTPNKYVKTLKIRGGYGSGGNDGIRDFGYLATVNGGFNYTLGNGNVITTGYSPLSLDNPDLKWEETSQTNIGFDAEIFSRFNISFDVFNKKTEGILMNVPIPGYVGVSAQPVANVASMENRGLEIELGYQNKIGQLNFSVSGNASFLKNEVTYVNIDADFIPGGASFQSMGPVTRIQVGHTFNGFYGFQTNGIFQNWDEVNAYSKEGGILIQPDAQPGDFRWVDNDGDGAITENDKTFLGSNIPKLTFGFTVNAQYKGFDLMMFAQGAAGHKIFQGLRRLDIGNSNYQRRALSRWTGEGTSNEYPRLTSNDVNNNFGRMSDFYLEDGDYMRLKIVQIGYTYRDKLLSKIGASSFRLYVTGENLFTITKYTGFDPEIGGGIFGVDKGFYPQARSFIIGAQLQF